MTTLKKKTKSKKVQQKTSGRCILAVEDSSGDFYQVTLKPKDMKFITQMAASCFKGTIKVFPDKFPLTLEKR